MLAPGYLLAGRYEIERFVGAGGMQYVYAATDKLVGRRVAIKTPKNQSAMKRFYRSAVLAARVNHPNVAKTLDYLEMGEDRFLVEEFVEGGDFSVELLDRASFLDPYMVAKIFHHLAKGVAAAHHADVVHRDLKPSNIMVTGGYSLEAIKITDFGIAKLAAEVLDEAAAGGVETLTLSQTAVGALPYMAPEAVEASKGVSRPADVWSLGAMIYHLLTGATPFGVGLKAVHKIMMVDILPAPAFLTASPQFAPLAQQVLDLALTCLKRDPASRPTADQLVASCQQLYYNPSPRLLGHVRRIDHNAYGFIGCVSGDAFFHLTSVYGPDRAAIGDNVMFSAFEGGGSPRAHPVVKLR
jgi:serine/threonine-protein kinase